MTGILFWALIFVVTLVILVKASDYFIDFTEKIGLSFGVSPLVLGVTVVALGTSLPELASSLSAVWQGASEVVVGNVVGSNITNIFFVLGAVALMVKKIRFDFEFSSEDMSFLFGSAFLLTVTIWDGVFTYFEAFLCLSGVLMYVGYNLSTMGGDDEERPKLEWYVFPMLAVCGVAIFLSAKFNIEAIIKISEIMAVPKELIALGAVALGTSLPELFVSISAVRKGKVDIALGNVLGSNIFNVFAVMGIPGMVGELKIPMVVVNTSIPLMIIGTFMYYFIARNGQFSRWEGMVLLLFYVFFLYQLVMVGGV